MRRFPPSVGSDILWDGVATPTATPARGKLKVYLGYAAGVGKTFRMLEEAQEAAQKGADIVVGYFEPHGRKDTISRTSGLEMIPRRKIEYRGSVFEEMNTPAILERHAAICLVDELPHTNIPGCERLKRWEDVIALLDAGIDVYTTMNIQHLESLNDQVFHITGIRVRETLPDWVLRQADEVVMVDLTPRALLNRLLRGVIYAQDKAQKAMDHFFKESTLVALRELALRETAHEVNVRHVEMEGPMPEVTAASRALEAASLVPPVAGKSRILVYVTAEPSAMVLLRRARRMADYLRADCMAVHVTGVSSTADDAEHLERILNFARNLHIETRVIEGAGATARHVAHSLTEFARINQITQILLARPHYGGLNLFPGRNLIHQIVGLAHDMEVLVIANRGQ
jgi:two-component system sensor histidine kinase KdpD